MSKETRRLKLKADLDALEAAYLAQLRAALQQCINGSWGLFRRHHAYYGQPVELLELGSKIDTLRKSLGLEHHAWHARLLEYRATEGAQAPGDPKRAQQFLAELDAGQSDERLALDEMWSDEPAMKAERIMYIEDKSNGIRGGARIGRVTYSKSGQTIRYRGRDFFRIMGFKSNYMSRDDNTEYWISGPRRDGEDGLYGYRPTEIDEDCRVEYWTQIRRQPARVNEGVS